MRFRFTGKGASKPQLDIKIGKLYLDPQNPRLPEEFQGKTEEEISYALFKYFDLEELAYSMAENGYFDEEPLVVIPKELPKNLSKIKSEDLLKNLDFTTYIKNTKTEFTVVEGNRRLGTVKILLDNSLRNKFKIKSWPSLAKDVEKDLSILPVIVYPRRQDVLAYVGVRHITGIMKWEPYAKARYVASMVDQGVSIEEIQRIVGDRSNSARKFYTCYMLVEQMKDTYDYNTENVKNNFSYLLLSSGQGPIKDYLGLPTKLIDINYKHPVKKDKLPNLRNLFSWLYGDKDKLPVIEESRDITDYLNDVLSSKPALEYLITTRKLKDAFDRSGGEERLLLTYLRRANTNLELAIGFIHRHKNNNEVKAELNKLKETLKTAEGITS